MKRIPLTQGKFAIVDDEDYDWLMQWKWCAQKTPRGFLAVRAGSVAGGGKQTLIRMHRLIMNTPAGMETDHRYHDTLDNRKAHLRVCTIAQNRHNATPNKNSSSKYKGVSWDKRNSRWAVCIGLNKKLTYLGRFEKEEDAAAAYNVAAIRMHGEFAWLNVI